MRKKLLLSCLLACYTLHAISEEVNLAQGQVASILGPFGAPLPEEFFVVDYTAIVAKGHGYSAQCVVLNKGRGKTLLVRSLRDDGRNYPFTLSIELPNGEYSNYFFEFDKTSQMEITLEAEGQRLSEAMNGKLSTLEVIIYSAFPFIASLHDRAGFCNELHIEGPSNSTQLRSQEFEDCCHPITEGYHDVSVRSSSGIAFAQLLINRWIGEIMRFPDGSVEIPYLANLTVYFSGVNLHQPLYGSYCIWAEPRAPDMPDYCRSVLNTFLTYGNMGDLNYLTLWNDLRDVIYGTGDGIAFRPGGYAEGPAAFIISNED